MTLRKVDLHVAYEMTQHILDCSHSCSSDLNLSELICIRKHTITWLTLQNLRNSVLSLITESPRILKRLYNEP